MQIYNIKVIGPQYAEPPMFITFISRKYNIEARYHVITSDINSVCVFINNYKDISLDISAIIPPILHTEQVYSEYIKGSDGIIYMITDNKEMDYMNREDFPLFSKIYHNYHKKVPLIILLNNIWCNKFINRLSESEVQKYSISGSVFLRTNIGFLSNQPTCTEGGIEALDILINQLEQRVN